MIEELMGEFNKEIETACIYVDKQGCRIQGYKPMVMTMFEQIIKGLVNSGVERDEIEYAIKVAFMNELETEKEVVNKLKSLLEKMEKEGGE